MSGLMAKRMGWRQKPCSRETRRLSGKGRLGRQGERTERAVSMIGGRESLEVLDATTEWKRVDERRYERQLETEGDKW